MIWELRHEFKIGLLIYVAAIPRSTYYYYEKQFKAAKPDKYAEIKVLIRKIYDDNKGRYLQEFTSVEHFIAELEAYIDWYNTKRIKLKLDGLSPVDYRLRAALQKRPRSLLVALHNFFLKNFV